MCRITARQAPRQRAEEVLLKQEPASVLYEQLQGYSAQPAGLQMALEEDLDFDGLFEDEEGPSLGTGELDLIALFSDDAPGPSSQEVSGPPQQQQQHQTQPQQQPALYAMAGPAVAVPAAATGVPLAGPVAAAPQTVQQLQLQAIMQQQLAAQQQQLAAGAVAGMPADLAHVQQYQAAAQMQAMLAAQATLRQVAPVSKRGKTQAEIEEQQERIKKRRRESAQRSRARKNSYMKTLEVENKALKMENERLRMELMKLSHKTGSTSSSKPDTPSPHHILLSEHTSGNHSSGDYSASEEMCGEKPTMSGGVSMPSSNHLFELVL